MALISPTAPPRISPAPVPTQHLQTMPSLLYQIIPRGGPLSRLPAPQMLMITPTAKMPVWAHKLARKSPPHPAKQCCSQAGTCSPSLRPPSNGACTRSSTWQRSLTTYIFTSLYGPPLLFTYLGSPCKRMTLPTSSPHRCSTPQVSRVQAK